MKTHKHPSSFLNVTLFHLSLFTLLTSAASDKFLLDCGSSRFSQFNGKNWTGDVGSEYLPTNFSIISTISAASDPFVPEVPYLTARVFHSPFTYSFPISPGQIFIRLYFYSSPYSALNYGFTVIANDFTLLDNFSPSNTAIALKSDYFNKDFSITTLEQKLYITFIPSQMNSKVFAFVNGIEIFPLPPNLCLPRENASLPFVGQRHPFSIHNETAFEFFYRVQSEGSDNFENVLGIWMDDSSYLSGPIQGLNLDTSVRNIRRFDYTCSVYFTPEVLYTTARTMGPNDAINVKNNLTWIFPVDSGFKYMIRLHFCEISPWVVTINQRVFNVYINNQVAENKMDLIALKGAPYVPFYRDYVVMVQGKEIKLDLHPNIDSRPLYADAIVNGIEIFKLSDENRSLGAHIQVNKKKVDRKAREDVIIGVVSAILGLFLVCFIALKLYKKLNMASSRIPQSIMTILSETTSDHCRQFSLEEIKQATSNFDENLIIGSGGFGMVYRGSINGGATKVAIKRGNPSSKQGLSEFRNEIELLSKLQHIHVVSLKGYCQENDEMILTYEYMANGTLRDHLYNTQKPPLSWKTRLEICIGAARGLYYLHTGSKHSIIHRDVKTANILLDEKWTAKISDFGLSRVGPTMSFSGHISTEVKGTFGYLDPEYYRRRKLTDKSDVYSFGVVLFEVLCGRPAVKVMAVGTDEEKVSLAEWALHCHKNGKIVEMMDGNLKGDVAKECLLAFVDTAAKCLAETGSKRPSMSDVLGNLERAQQLQEISDAMVDRSNSFL